MSGIVKVGEKIPLVAHLECPDGATLYVEAIIKRPDRSQIPGSPIDLGSEGDGLFFDDSLNMPDEPFVTATFNVFEDAAKTIPAENYCSVTETYNRAEGGSGGVIVTNTPDRIVGRVKDERLSAQIADHGPAKAHIASDQATAEILDDQGDLRENEKSYSIRSQ